MSGEAEGAEFSRLHPATFAVVMADIAKKFLIPGLIAFFFGGFPGETLVIFAAGPAFVWAVIRYLSMSFALTDDYLLLKEGLFDRSLRRIPLDRIRSIETRRSPVHRFFKVDDVIIHTAGGSEPEATLSVLDRATVEQLRQSLPRFSRKKAGDEQEAGNVWRSRTADLVGYGLTHHRGMFLAFALMGAAWQFDIWEIGRVRDFFSHPVVQMESEALAWTMTIILGVILFYLISRLTSILWTLVTFHKFTAHHDGEHLDLHFGLISQRNTSLPDKRIHVIQVEQRWLQRHRQKFTVVAWSAANMDEGDDDDDFDDEWKSLFNHMVLQPQADQSQTRTLLQRLADEQDWLEQDWQRIDPAAFRRELLLNMLWFVPSSLGLGVSLWPWGLIFTPIFLAIILWDAHVKARHTYYAVSSAGIWLRGGYFKKTWRLVRHAHARRSGRSTWCRRPVCIAS